MGYVSSSLLSNRSTYDNQSFSSLHLIVGTYQWDWGHGARADSFTLDISVADAVPEPPSLLLLGLPLGLLMLLAAHAARLMTPRPPTESAARG